MSTPPPILFVWDEHSMVPHPRFSRLAEHSFTSGHAYRMIVEEERSAASHRQYFAAVAEAWMNLPEQMQLAFPTIDHLRKYALIKAGFCTVKKVANGRHVAVNGYAIVTEEDGVTTIYEAKSQNYRSMSKADFQDSKTKVIEVLAAMVDVTPDELLNAGEENGAR